MFGEEHIGTLQYGCDSVVYFKVAMKDFDVVESFEAASDVDEEAPDIVFGEMRVILDVFVDLSEEIAAFCVFHDDAQGRGGIFAEGLLIGDDVRMAIGDEGN
jgi:hypothetical protein